MLYFLRISVVLLLSALFGLLIVGDVSAAEAAVKLPTLNQTRIGPDALPFEEIVFVKRMQYSSDHYYTDINNGTAGNRFLPGNSICTRLTP